MDCRQIQIEKSPVQVPALRYYTKNLGMRNPSAEERKQLKKKIDELKYSKNLTSISIPKLATINTYPLKSKRTVKSTILYHN